MSSSKNIEWQTKLTGTSQSLVSAMDKETNDTRWNANHVKPLVDELTVAELRSTSVELDEELDRLRVFVERIHELKEKLKEVAAV